uniref:Glycosyl transferase 64 domain-containing protein n=1 Tax=Glossina brevipalpis TaxID=37001 RepID=A0A1A9WHX9_9MUSC
MEITETQVVYIIRERLPDFPVRNSIIWNNSPGALLTLPTFTDSLRFMPFQLENMNAQTRSNYTAVIYVQIGAPLNPNNALYKLVKTITKSQFIDKIIILWATDRPVPSRKRWPPTYHIPFHVICLDNSDHKKPSIFQGPVDVIDTADSHVAEIIKNNHQQKGNAHSSNSQIFANGETTDERLSISQRFFPFNEIETDAVLSLDEDAILNTDEVDFAFTVWRDFPDRIVGYPARAHFWDDSKNAWGYTSKWTNYYSIVLTGAAFYHRYYNYLYTNWISLLLLKTVQQSSNCEDILMNFLVSHVTRKAPIKVTQRKGYKDRETSRSPWNDPDHFIQRQSCLNTFATVFGYMPLVRSNMRLDPILYRDPVSNLRKKYRQIELVGS